MQLVHSIYLWAYEMQEAKICYPNLNVDNVASLAFYALVLNVTPPPILLLSCDWTRHRRPNVRC